MNKAVPSKYKSAEYLMIITEIPLCFKRIFCG